MERHSHLSDEELLLAADGELSTHDAGRVEFHLAACWACRARKQEIEAAIGEFISAHRHSLDWRIPSADGPRALLKAQLAQLAEPRRMHWRLSWAVPAAAALGLAAVTYLGLHAWDRRPPARVVAVTVPNPSLTPGATVLVGRNEVCMESNTKNKAVPVALQRRVFDEYGIRSATPGRLRGGLSDYSRPGRCGRHS